MIKLAASLLAADYLNIGAEIRRMADAGADYLHYDVMDGVFVPNITFGQGVLRAARECPLKLDAHLMIVNPEKYIAEFANAGAEIITIHAEATNHLHRALQMIRAAGCKAGVALNPATCESALAYVINDVDLVLVMGVNPGFGNQKFIPATLEKIARVRRMLDAAGSSAYVEVDGGVSPSNARELAERGADLLVTGSALFASADPKAFIDAVHAISI